MLSGRKTHGEYEGAILTNTDGNRDHDMFYRQAAFVPEVTHLPGELTVLQVLQYSALLAMPSSTTKAARAKRVHDVVTAMSLEDVLGEQLNRDPDSSHGQTKIHCVAIATELLRAPGRRKRKTGRAGPSKLMCSDGNRPAAATRFLQDPLQHLPATSSTTVMRLLHALTRDLHISVICSISEASTDDYRYFDHLCYMNDGEVFYTGPAGDRPLQALAARGAVRKPAGNILEHIGASPCEGPRLECQTI